MNIPKAIEILKTEVHLAERQPETGIPAALKLGIEALLDKLAERIWLAASSRQLLPGETND